MDLASAITIFIATLIFIIGFVVLFKSSQEKTSKLFFAFCLCLAVWMISTLLENRFNDSYLIRLFLGLDYGSAIILSYIFLLLTLNFPESNKGRYLLLELSALLPALALAYFAYNGQIVEFAGKSGPELNVKTGAYYLYYSIVVFLYIGAGLFTLINKYRKSTGLVRLQSLYVLLGLSITAILMIVSALILPRLMDNPSIYKYGIYGTLFFVGFTAYSIIKHHLLNIRVILTETAIVIVIMSLFVQTLLSATAVERFVNFIVLVVVAYGGYLLVRSVQKEIERRKQIQKLASDLEIANKHLEELDRIKDDFLSMASHELNTPISAIEGYLSMIIDEKMGGELSETHKKYLTSVYTSSKRLAALVKDLLNVSRIESGRIHIIYSEAQIEEVIEQSVMEVKSKVDEAKHTLTVVKPDKPMPKTWFDVPRITEVIINFIGNSIKYTEEGGKIEVGVKSDDQNITVWVKDNGRGIPKERQTEMFQKFTQANILKDEAKGTGLGLYISKNFVELQKGKIWFESEGEGKGTTFYFSLPILKQQPIDEHEGEGVVIQMKSTAGASAGAPTEQGTGLGVQDSGKTENPGPPDVIAPKGTPSVDEVKQSNETKTEIAAPTARPDKGPLWGNDNREQKDQKPGQSTPKS